MWGEIIVNQHHSDFAKAPLYRHTRKHARINTFACTPTLTPTPMSPCDLMCSAAAGLCQSVGSTASPPRRWATDSVTQWQGRRDTWRRSHVSKPGIYICTSARIWREERGHLWQITRWLPRWLFLTQLYYFLRHLIPFHFLFSHELSASLAVSRPRSSMRTLVLSHQHICEVFAVLSCQISPNLPDGLTAVDETTELGFLWSLRSGASWDCPHKRQPRIMMPR